MSKEELIKNQTLVESSEFSAKIKLSKALKESVKLSQGKNGTLIVRNIPCTILNRRNQNGRIYPTDVMEEAIKNAAPAIDAKQLLSKPNEHPSGSFLPPSEASHVIIGAYIKKGIKLVVEGKREKQDVLFMDWEILNTQNGKDLRALFEAECSIGTSIRGVGDLRGDTVENYELLGCDCVGNPSSSTFTRMPISESVKVEFRDEKALTEGFTVSSSSTDVARDIESAGVLANKLDQADFATVTNTSTKLEHDIDPKTGATTTLVTFEADTSDDVADINQALVMAKKILTNPYSHVDSVTIENIEEEEETQKESVAEEASEEYVPEEKIEESEETVDESKETVSEATETKLNEDVDWGDDKNLFKTLHHIRDGVIDKDGVTFDFIPLDDGNVKVITKFPIPSADGGEEWETSDGVVSYDKARTYWHKLESSGLYTYELDETTITEAKEEADPKEGRKFVLKAPAGFVAMDGNALVFNDDPKEALHFVVGKEESGLVHLSGVEKILDTMGVYDVEKYYRKPENEIEAMNEEEPVEEGLIGGTLGGVAGGMLGSAIAGPLGALSGAASGYSLGSDIADDLSENNDEKIVEANGSNTKFVAEVHMHKNDEMESVDTVRVSAVELQSALSEVANLWKMKMEKKEGDVTVFLLDTESGEKYLYNQKSNTLDTYNEDVTESTLTEEDTGVEQNGDTLTVELDDQGNEVTKEFDNQAQASVIKAGLEQGKLPGDVMLSEDGDGILSGWYVANDKIGITGPFESKEEAEEEFKDFLDEVSIEYLSNENEENVEEPKIESGWYAGAENIGVVGPFESREAAEEEFKDFLDKVSIEYLSSEEDDEENLNEVLFNKPSAPSDDYMEEPTEENK